MQEFRQSTEAGPAGLDAHEIFDVVNENDQVIDAQPRYIVHQKNLLHRAVHALVYDQSNRLYLQKRALCKDTNPGLWDTSMGGHLESGETYDQAVIRETREELGIILERPPEKLFKFTASELTGYEFIWVYKIVHAGQIDPCEREISEGRWVTARELTQWIHNDPESFTPTLTQIMEQCKRLHR